MISSLGIFPTRYFNTVTQDKFDEIHRYVLFNFSIVEKEMELSFKIRASFIYE